MPDDTLRRVNLLLYESDCKLLEKWHGYGWSARVREIVHFRVAEAESLSLPAPRRLGDYDE